MGTCGSSFFIAWHNHLSTAGGTFVIGENAELWRTLCEQAVTEQNLDKLLELVHEINRLLEEKEQRFKTNQPNR
jgi:hypothetical protein